MSHAVERYSLRLLSPFNGTTRILQHQEIRAISNDGVHWRLQIRLASDNESKRYTLFGLWSRAEGVKEFSVHPLHTSPSWRQRANAFVAQLPEWLDERDFPLLDNLECWLLDQKQQPLALLTSCPINQQLVRLPQPVWVPCAVNDHTFVATQAYVVQQPERSTTPISHRDLVAQLVHRTAGQHRQMMWIARQEDGSGVVRYDGPPQQTPVQRHLPANAFPHFLLRQHWENANEQQLANDFFHWQSPWLLTLPDLNETERRLLEIQACEYPQRLHALYRLYPDLLQKELIYTTLVQAKLEKRIPVINSEC